MENIIRFYLNGQLQTVVDSSPTDLLIDYLRSPQINCMGTKLSCGEGGCGACTVLWSRYDSKENVIKEVSTNACLRPLNSLDGSAVTTIEGLKIENNLIQKQIRDCSASQCGFCTPGFEMNMFSLLKMKDLTSLKIEDSFGGNLCRCTGYISILNAMHNIGSTEKIIRDKFLNENSWIEQKHFPELKSILIEDTSHVWYRPITLSALLSYLQDNQNNSKDIKLVRGNTSVGIYKQDVEDPKILIDILQIDEFQKIERHKDFVAVGSGITLTELSDYIKSHFGTGVPEYRGMVVLQDHIAKIAGHQVRNTGSVAGNLMLVKNHRWFGKPFPSDLFTVLAVLQTKIESTDYFGELSVEPILEWVKNDNIQRVVLRIIIPFNTTDEYIQTYKISKRIQNAHAIVNAGFKFRLSENNEIISASMIFGGIARVAFDLPYLNILIKESYHSISIEDYQKVREVLLKELKDRIKRLDLDDVSEEVRIRLCINLLYKFYSYIAEKRDIKIFSDQSSGSKTIRPIAKGLHDTLIAPYYNPLENIVNTVFSKHNIKIEGLELIESVELSDNSVTEHSAERTNEAVVFTKSLLEKTKITKIDAKAQTTGKAKYTHDLHGPGNTLQAWYVISERRFADFEYKDGYDNLIKTLTSNFNNVSYICVHDLSTPPDTSYRDDQGQIIKQKYDPVFAEGYVTCYGQPIGLVAAATLKEAKKAAKFVQSNIIYKDKGKIIATLKDAVTEKSMLTIKGEISHITRPVSNPVDEKWLEEPCAEENLVFTEGKLFTGAQLHFYMEPQGALAIPGEDDDIKVFSSSQHLAKCQEKLASLLNLAHNKVTLGVTRLGGGFGGKELRQVYIAAAAGIAAYRLQKPVRLLLERQIDIQMVGTRHPFYGSFWLSTDPVTYKIHKFKIDYKLDGGNSQDCTIPVMELAILHGENAYDIPVNKTTGSAFLTHIQSRTAFRSFGLVQSILIVEEAIEKTAHELGITAERLREANFYKDGQYDQKPYPITPYGQELPHCRINQVWMDFKQKVSFEERKKKIEEFNTKNKFKKRGLSMIPLKYGISYTSRTSNQGSAYLFAYKADGSVIVHHGGIEMGQGLHTKMAQLAADTLGIDVKWIKIAESDTSDIPNASSTGASTGSDLNGYAVVEAARILRSNLEKFCEEYISTPLKFEDLFNKKEEIEAIENYKEDWKKHWAKIISAAYRCRRNISAQYTYASPELGKLDLKLKFPQIPKNSRLFYYFNYCVAASEVEVDMLTGQFEIIRTDIVYDAGDTLNDNIDYGQIEGGFVQGVGYLTTEEVLYEEGGKVITDGTWTYKPPCTKTIPQEFNVYLLKYLSSGIKTDAPKDMYGINSSKSTGEPPLVLANTVYYAIKHAILAFRKDYGKKEWIQLDPPAGIENILSAAWKDIEGF